MFLDQKKCNCHDLGTKRAHLVENCVDPNSPLFFEIHDPSCETKIQSSNAKKG